MALLVTIIIWASYLVVVRAAVTTSLGPIDVGLLRSLPAALIFLPFTLRHGLKPSGATAADVIAIGVIGGGVFILCLAHGLRFAPAADAGIFTPSMLPVCVALLSVAFLSVRYAGIQVGGLVLILVGAAAVGGFAAFVQAEDGVWRGHVLFLCASMSWAIYTVGYRRSALSPLAAAAIMATVPAIGFGVCALIWGTDLHRIDRSVLILQLSQGIAAGVIANFTYLYAIKNLGAQIPAASAALVPVLAGLGAWVFLDETLSPAKGLAMGVTCVGVVLASGLVRQRKRVG